MREDYRPDNTAMALERLQTSTPDIAHRWLNSGSFKLFVLDDLLVTLLVGLNNSADAYVCRG